MRANIGVDSNILYYIGGTSQIRLPIFNLSHTSWKPTKMLGDLPRLDLYCLSSYLFI